MPSQEHEVLAEIVRTRPELALTLLRAAGHDVGPYDEAWCDDASLTATTELRADALIVLRASGRATCVVLVEIQLARDGEKAWTWPAYLAVARARHRCTACLVVVAPDARVARWASRVVVVGPNGRFQPVVVGPEAIPKVSEREARADPELALISLLAHADDADVAMAAVEALDAVPEGRARVYFDVIWDALGEAVRRALEAKMQLKYEYKSDFAKRYVAQGREEGRIEGREIARVETLVHAIASVLEARGFALTDEERARIAACSDVTTLDKWHRRAVTVASIEELLRDA